MDKDQQISAILSDAAKRMDGSLANLDHSLKGLRTGRVSSSILDNIRVEAYGGLMALNQVANVNLAEGRALVVQPWDQDLLKSIEKAISEAGLGLNPSRDGGLIRVLVPELNEERRKELSKKAGEYAEDTRVSVRNVRKDAMNNLRKLEHDKMISKDEYERVSGEIQKITDNHIDKAEIATEAKKKEIISV